MIIAIQLYTVHNDDSSVSIAVPEDLPEGQEVYGTVIMMILMWVGPGYCVLVS